MKPIEVKDNIFINSVKQVNDKDSKFKLPVYSHHARTRFRVNPYSIFA